MRNRLAKFVPVIALSALAIGCSDQVTQPGDTAGAVPIDTLLQRAPIDTFASAQRAPIDTFASAVPIDTFASAVPIDTLY
jgi:hypothetical protein